MPEGRPQLYKIRRLMKDDDAGGQSSYYEWFTYDGELVHWIRDEIDAWAFTDMKKAQIMCETVKSGKLRHPCAVFHSVVPV